MMELRAAARFAASDDHRSNVTINTPVEVQPGDVAVAALGRWEAGDPAVTVPSPFVEVGSITSAETKLRIYVGRLDVVNISYQFSWTGLQWSSMHMMFIAGGESVDNPVVDSDIQLIASSANTPNTLVDVPDTGAFMAHFAFRENSSSQTTVPSEFTPALDGNVLNSNYRIEPGPGTYSASGGVMSLATKQIAALVAIKEDQIIITPSSRWQRGDGVGLAPYLLTDSGLVEME